MQLPSPNNMGTYIERPIGNAVGSSVAIVRQDSTYQTVFRMKKCVGSQYICTK